MFAIELRDEVVAKDLPKIDVAWQKKIKAQMVARLSTYPQLYSKPLAKSLKNFRKLRVGSYRVIFKVEGQKIIVEAIQHRSVVYKIIQKRL